MSEVCIHDSYGKSVVSLADEIRKLNSVRWSDFSDKILEISLNMKKDDMRKIFTDMDLFSYAFVPSRNRWITRRTLEELLPTLSNFTNDILMESEVSEVKETILSMGLYTDISV